MMVRRVQLLEHGPYVETALSSDERDGLLAADAGLEMTPIPGSPERWRLRGGHRVGVLALGSLVVEIRPKVPIDRVLFLLGYASGAPELRAPSPHVGELDGLHEAMAWLFADALRGAMHRGLPHGYVTREDDGVAVRGRIRFEDQLRRRPGAWLPIAVRFDDFTADTELNRLLKSALRRLLALPLRHAATIGALRRWLRVFAFVSDLPVGARGVSVPTLSRLEQHLHGAVSLARLIVEGGSLEPRLGTSLGPAFTLDMAVLFERFVRETLREALGLGTRWCRPMAGGLHLDRERRVELRPDLFWLGEGGPLFVGDVKYKHAENGLGRREDLYQLLAYVVRLGLGGGMLIHASVQEREVHHVVMGEKRLEVVGLDLSVPPSEILAQVRAIAAAILDRAGSAAGVSRAGGCSSYIQNR